MVHDMTDSSQDKTKPRRVIPIQAVAAGGTHVETVSLYMATEKIYPREILGWFMKWRWAFVFLTQVVFYGMPWVVWNNRQAVLFDLGTRRFYLFDLVLYPQDFIFLTGLLIISAYGLFLFTAVAGRVWCGFACPQTVYTEIFLWIERRWEGDRGRRMKLDKAGFSLEKAWRKGGKHLSWIALAAWTGFTFVGYFTPIKVLWQEAFSLGMGPWEMFWTGFYGFATYGNAGFMREQVCKYMCPYARFQSAMFDRDTLVISYDQARGDPRGTRARSADLQQLGLGDCIDCGLCVQVCPTGIDIRNGLQYECIGCAACIDVCDSVMDKMRYPRGLIKYATEAGMAQKLTSRQMMARMLRPRILIYSGILVAISLALVASLALKSPFKVDVVRDRGSLARIAGEGNVENVYRLQLMNATEETQRLKVEVSGLPGAKVTGVSVIQVEATEARWFPVVVQVPQESAHQLSPGAHPIQFRIERLAGDGQGSNASVVEKSTFVIPR